MTTLASLCMYSLTLSPPTATTQAIVGDFLGAGRQQILSASGSLLTILEVSKATNTLSTIHTHDIFGIIRGLATFRLAGLKKDFIIVSSDSGRISTLEYLPVEKKFKSVHLETYGKSGVRRVIPGQYLASDPRGRACMIASVEKNKLVYILNRDPKGGFVISSPLEAHKAQTLVVALCALDVGYDNPIFAALEIDYSDCEVDSTGQALEQVEKQLVYYELDLGLNHVIRKWSDTVDRTAHILFRVPGGTAGPSGVLVCGVDNITYHHMNQDTFRIPIPRREGYTEDKDRKRQIVAGTMHNLKNSDPFYLLQTEDGDLFKLTIELKDNKHTKQPNGAVKRLTIKYFDTVPVATSLCLLKSGFLYVACENGNRFNYELEKLGNEDDEPIWTSKNYDSARDIALRPIMFQPRPLYNLILTETCQDLNPIMAAHVSNPTEEDAPQMYTLCGTGARSTFRTVRNALGVLDLVESQLPQAASAVWTTKFAADDQYDGYIVLSLVSMTLVLSIGEEVEEVSDSAFLRETITLGVQQFGLDNVLQVHPRGIRHIDINKKVTDWHAPQHRTIVCCASNNRQVAIALSSGEINYFECDSDGALAKSDDEVKMESQVLCMALGEIPEGRVRSDMLAVGSSDMTIRMLSLSPDDSQQRLQQLSLQGVSSAPSSLCIMPMSDRSSHGSSQFLHIGLSSGIYIRTVLTESGDLDETRRKFLGPEPVKIVPCEVRGQNAVLALTSRPWLGYPDPKNNSLALTPLRYMYLQSAFTFSSSQFHGLIGIQGADLRIFAIDKIESNVHQESIPLTYTPYRFIPQANLFYVIEREQHTMAPPTRVKVMNDAKKKAKEKAEEAGMTWDEAEQEPQLPAEDFGYPHAVSHWSSCIEIVDPHTEKAVLEKYELDNNEAAVSIATVVFDSVGPAPYLAVGTGRHIGAEKTGHIGAEKAEAYIRIYRILEGGKKLEYLHKTKVPAIPLALLAFKGRLAVGVGPDLALYDIGMKQLLRKSLLEKATPTRIMQLHTQGSRIVCADQRESLTYVVHKEEGNRLISFVDDTVARYTTCSAMNDYETSVGGDKFGNIWMLRCPADVSASSDEEGAGMHLLQDKSYLGGTPSRLDLMMHYFTQDIPMAIQKTSLTPGGDPVVFWAGLQGTLGVFIPFNRRRDVKMFQQLELAMRQEDKPICGRDHLAYRGYYAPVKGAIDGDLCERFLLLSNDSKQSVAVGLDGTWTPSAIEERIWTMRGLLAF